jgi:hypothetical protein
VALISEAANNTWLDESKPQSESSSQAIPPKNPARKYSVTKIPVRSKTQERKELTTE